MDYTTSRETNSEENDRRLSWLNFIVTSTCIYILYVLCRPVCGFRDPERALKQPGPGWCDLVAWHAKCVVCPYVPCDILTHYKAWLCIRVHVRICIKSRLLCCHFDTRWPLNATLLTRPAPVWATAEDRCRVTALRTTIHSSTHQS